MHMMRQPALNLPFASNAPARQAGFTMVELLVAIALSLFIVAALATMFVASSRSRNELAAANEQIENGRYALVTLSDDLQLAGYLSHFNVAAAALVAPLAKPDPCATTVSTLRGAMVMHVQGYNNTVTLSCVSDRKANTDVLVIRRVSTCTKDTADCGEADGYVDGAPYFQASTCTPALGDAEQELSSLNPVNWYRLDTNIGNLNRRKRGPNGTCVNGAPLIRQFLTHIYFVANNFQGSDGIPTLKRVDLGTGGAFGTPITIASGIDNLQFEYGIDYGIDLDNDGVIESGPPDEFANTDGFPDVYVADPDVYNRATPGSPFATCAANLDCVSNWQNVMAVRIFLLARNTTESPAFTDTKTYEIGTGATVGPFDDRFKRHAYQTVVRLTNPAGRRE